MATKTLLVAVDLGKASTSVVSRAAELAQVALRPKSSFCTWRSPRPPFFLVGKAKRAATAAAWPLRTPKSQAQLERV